MLTRTRWIAQDIPAESMDAGIKWADDEGFEWQTFPEYMDALDKLHYSADITAMISHGQVRSWVLGDRCNEADKPGGPTASPLTFEEKQVRIYTTPPAPFSTGCSAARDLRHIAAAAGMRRRCERSDRGRSDWFFDQPLRWSPR